MASPGIPKSSRQIKANQGNFLQCSRETRTTKLLDMKKTMRQRVALTIAGSDSGGGAGIQADLKTFSALGVHGTSVITCVTAQNPRRVIGIGECKAEIVAQQMEAVFEVFPPDAMKTGMLFSEEIIQVVAGFLAGLKKKPVLVVDPVMVSTSGKTLLLPAALKALQEKLLPLASVATPNLPEAELLTKLTIRAPEQMRLAARRIHEQFGCAVLVKGGHLRGFREALDIFYDGRKELMLSVPRVGQGHKLHGTGCTYSAAIAAYCARGEVLENAVSLGKAYITNTIAKCLPVAGEYVLNHRT
jgi:hydroxymethylpyrimidine/phosphomethylpyrimidine kinase